MVKIRLSRTGRKNNPSYRVVITNAREKRESKAIEIVGYYLPLDKKYELKEDRVKYWLSVGAQPTDTVRYLLVKQGLVTAPKHKKVFTKTPGKKAKDRAPKAE